MNLRTHLIGSLLAGVALLVLGGAQPAFAADGGAYQVELRIIEGSKGSGPQQIDPKLKVFAKDLANVPFQKLRLMDSQSSSMRDGETVSLEMPRAGKGARQFLQVAAHGRQAGGKLRFQLSIESLRFDTLVAVPDGGTIFIAVPKSGKRGEGPTMLFAFTARAKK